MLPRSISELECPRHCRNNNTIILLKIIIITYSFRNMKVNKIVINVNDIGRIINFPMKNYAQHLYDVLF